MSYLDFGGLRRNGGSSFFRRIPHSTDNEEGFIAAKRKEFNNTDIYRSIFTYETEDLENSRIVGPFYMDFDSNDIEYNFKFMRHQINSIIQYLIGNFNIPKELQELYYSGSKGFHLIIQPEVFGFKYDTDYPEQYLKLARLIDIERQRLHNYESMLDFKIYDRRRVFRIPNSINSKSGLYKIPITYEELQRFTLNEIKNMARKPRNISFASPYFIPKARRQWEYWFNETESSNGDIRKEKEKVHKGGIRRTDGTLLPCIKHILNIGIDQGSRNNTTVALASSLFQAGYNTDSVYEILCEWNQKNNPPLSDSEITHTMISAQSMVSSDKNYGCPSIENLGLCTPEACKIAINRRKRH